MLQINYFGVPEKVSRRTDLSSTDKLVCSLIATFSKCRMSQKEMAYHLGLNPSQVNRSIKKLKEKGLVHASPLENCLLVNWVVPFKQLQDYSTINEEKNQSLYNPEIAEMLDNLFKKVS